MLYHSTGKTIKQFAGNLNNFFIQDHHLIKCNTIYNLEKLNSRELYHMQLSLNMINLRVKVITRKILMIMFSTGNWYIGYPVLLHLKQKFVFSSITLSLPVPRWTGHNTDLPLDSNISKTVRVNIAFALNILKRIFNKLSNGIQVDTICTCVSQVIDV